MIAAEVLVTILGTGFTVGATVAVAGRWVVGAVIREDTQPLREAMVSLKHTADNLATAMSDAKVAQQKGADELHEAIDAVRAVLSNHQERIAVLETIANQQALAAKRAPRIRAKGE
jgi:gas vesicle protein